MISQKLSAVSSGIRIKLKMLRIFAAAVRREGCRSAEARMKSLFLEAILTNAQVQAKTGVPKKKS